MARRRRSAPAAIEPDAVLATGDPPPPLTAAGQPLLESSQALWAALWRSPLARHGGVIPELDARALVQWIRDVDELEVVQAQIDEVGHLVPAQRGIEINPLIPIRDRLATRARLAEQSFGMNLGARARILRHVRII